MTKNDYQDDEALGSEEDSRIFRQSMWEPWIYLAGFLALAVFVHYNA